MRKFFKKFFEINQLTIYLQPKRLIIFFLFRICLIFELLNEEKLFFARLKNSQFTYIPFRFFFLVFQKSLCASSSNSNNNITEGSAKMKKKY